VLFGVLVVVAMLFITSTIVASAPYIAGAVVLFVLFKLLDQQQPPV